MRPGHTERFAFRERLRTSLRTSEAPRPAAAQRHEVGAGEEWHRGEHRGVALTLAEVETFIEAPKVAPADRAMSWQARNKHNRRCHVPVEAGGARVGEVVLVVNVAVRRHFNFALLRGREAVLRWDFAMPPARHRNPRSAAGFEPRIRATEHEHVWRPGLDLDCVVALDGLGEHDHRQAFEAFCDRANIDLRTLYVPPPPLGEQLTLE
jgi:hypothetical protein